MKRPDGFDEGPAQPTPPAATSSGRETSAERPERASRPTRARASIVERLRSAGGDRAAGADEPERGDRSDAADERASSDRSDARDRPATDDASLLAGAAGTAGRGLSRGFAAVATRLRELSPDEDFVDPDAPAPRPRRTPLEHDAALPDDGPGGAADRSAETAHDARVAGRRRWLVERAEIRRFTRRARHRRAAWITAGAVVLVLVLSVVTAVYSPLMALRRIEVQGTSRVDAAQVQQTLDAQLGTPLARVDFAEIKRQMAGFPLIASYVTEEQPPHTLVVTITERQPIVAVQTSSGYDLVDPAGIVVEASKTKPAGMPLAGIAASQVGDQVFRTMTDVVLALPASLRSTVAQVTASTADDVTLTLTSGSKVVWGNPDDSDAKATLLSGLVADHDKRDPTAKVEYDVSAPDNGIVRSQN